jgi:hypothetical protein
LVVRTGKLPAGFKTSNWTVMPREPTGGITNRIPLASSKAKSTNSWHFDQENYGNRTRRTTAGIKSRRTTLW